MKKSIFTLTELHVQISTVLGLGAAEGHLSEFDLGVASAMMMDRQECRDCSTAKHNATVMWTDIVRRKGEPDCPTFYDSQLNFNMQDMHEYCMYASIRPNIIGHHIENADKWDV